MAAHVRPLGQSARPDDLLLFRSFLLDYGAKDLCVLVNPGALRASCWGPDIPELLFVRRFH